MAQIETVGNASDGNYMLLSQAIKLGLFHPRCRHGRYIYFKELEDIEFDNNDAAEETIINYNKDVNYINRNIDKFKRLELGSIDKDNIKYYSNIKKVVIVRENLLTY